MLQITMAYDIVMLRSTFFDPTLENLMKIQNTKIRTLLLVMFSNKQSLINSGRSISMLQGV